MTNGEKIQSLFPNKIPHVGFNEKYGQVWIMENGKDVANFTLDWWNAEYQKPTTIKDLGVDYTINSLDDFIEFGRKAFGVELTVKKSDNPDTYAKLFGTTKNDLADDCISRADAIRVASGYCHPSNVAKELAKLPSVTITYLDCFADGLNMANNSTNKMLDKIRAEIEELPTYDPKFEEKYTAYGMRCDVLEIIDKYKADKEDKE